MNPTHDEFTDLVTKLTQAGQLSELQKDLAASLANVVGTPGVFSSKLPQTPAVVANGTNGASAIGAASDTGVAVSGWSDHGNQSIGVRGHSKDGWGVVGQSDSGIGLWGESTQGIGVYGKGKQAGHFDGNVTVANPNGTALSAMSNSGLGLYAKGDVHAGLFDGNVSVNSPGGAAVFANNTSTTGYGIHGRGGRYAGFFEGDVSVIGDVILSGADCAEEFDVAEATIIEPGTVVVLDQDGALHQSQQAYDKKVAGVISGAGDYEPGLILDRRQLQDNRLPVALVGKVYCKVDAQYAPVEVGDLLTTSPTPGHAMKAEDPFKAFGAVIGKALRGLQNGQGLVPILVALQ